MMSDRWSSILLSPVSLCVGVAFVNLILTFLTALLLLQGKPLGKSSLLLRLCQCFLLWTFS